AAILVRDQSREESGLGQRHDEFRRIAPFAVEPAPIVAGKAGAECAHRFADGVEIVVVGHWRHTLSCAGRRFNQPQTLSAISTIMASLAHCSSSASTLPSSVEAKPHCGDRQSCSSATYLVASSMRLLMSSFFSSRPLFEVTRPSTSCLLPLGKCRSGSKSPARSLS